MKSPPALLREPEEDEEPCELSRSLSASLNLGVERSIQPSCHVCVGRWVSLAGKAMSTSCDGSSRAMPWTAPHTKKTRALPRLQQWPSLDQTVRCRDLLTPNHRQCLRLLSSHRSVPVLQTHQFALPRFTKPAGCIRK